MFTPATKRSTAELAAFATSLLVEDLPAPRYFSVSQSGQEICFQFGDSAESYRALAQWANRFVGIVTGCPHTHSGGSLPARCFTG